jgi:hypothetical protein
MDATQRHRPLTEKWVGGGLGASSNPPEMDAVLALDHHKFDQRLGQLVSHGDSGLRLKYDGSSKAHGRSNVSFPHDVTPSRQNAVFSIGTQ